MKVTKGEILGIVFSDFKFPQFSFDIIKLVKELSLHVNETPQSSVKFSLRNDSDKSLVLGNVLKSLIKNIKPNEEIYKIIELSKSLKKVIEHKEIRLCIESDIENNSIFKSNGNLIWLQGAYWPSAYSTVLKQFINIIELFERDIKARDKIGRKASNNMYLYSLDTKTGKKTVSITSEQPRHMPTEFHYAAASLGEWIGGSTSIQYFGLYATKPQILKSATNIKYCKIVGYNDLDAAELDESGLIGIPMSVVFPLFTAQENMNVLGSLPIDEINIANLPKTLPLSPKEQVVKTNLTGLIVDKYYRNVYFAKKLEFNGLYGHRDVLRDHYTDFYQKFLDCEMMRCKNYIAPIINVGSFKEIEEIISLIPQRGQGGLFFRGQTSFYELTRTKNIKKLLFGNSNSSEPSLITSSSRNKFDYDNFHFRLKNYIAENNILKDNDLEKKDLWEKLLLDPKCKLDYSVMALAQHYGIPSHGLDVTQDIDVALWFATNKFVNDSDTEKCHYNKISKNEWQKESSKWPVIFVFQTILNSHMQSLQDCEELSELNLQPLRPSRQSAKFFIGGHSDQQNRLAESVVCAFRLSPSDYETKVSFDYLFPSPDQDIAYKLMLDFKAEQKQVLNINDSVNDFH